MNPMDMMKTLMNNGGSPQQMIMNMIGKNSNPMINNLMSMAQKGDTQGIENFARNIFNEKGKNFDEEFANFMKQVK